MNLERKRPIPGGRPEIHRTESKTPGNTRGWIDSYIFVLFIEIPYIKARNALSDLRIPCRRKRHPSFKSGTGCTGRPFRAAVYWNGICRRKSGARERGRRFAERIHPSKRIKGLLNPLLILLPDTPMSHIQERRIAVAKICRVLLGLAVIISVLSGGHALAQSTIFNIPTTDTAAQGKVYAEFDFLMQAARDRMFPGHISTIPAWWSEDPATSNSA